MCRINVKKFYLGCTKKNAKLNFQTFKSDRHQAKTFGSKRNGRSASFNFQLWTY